MLSACKFCKKKLQLAYFVGTVAYYKFAVVVSCYVASCEYNLIIIIMWARVFSVYHKSSSVFKNSLRLCPESFLGGGGWRMGPLTFAGPLRCRV